MEIKSKFAFMKNIDLDELSQIKLSRENFHRSKSQARSSLSFLKYNDDDFKHTNSNQPEKPTNLMRSIKEFSYFDWSKVNLYENRNYLADTSINDFQKHKDKSQHELPQVITIRFT